jgi:hypothetical protein
MGESEFPEEGRSLPPDVREWIDNVARQLREALAIPAVRAEISELLTGDEKRRARRLREVAAELEGREVTIRLRSDDASD